MDVTLHLPVRSYVYKYCRTLFGRPGKPFDHWHLYLHSKESKMFHALLERSPYKYEKYPPNDIILDVLIPSKIALSKGCYIKPDHLVIFNDYVKQVIMDEIVAFHTGIQSRIGLKTIEKITVNRYQADKKIRVLRVEPADAQKFFWQKSIIYDILAKYDITEEEISYDSAVKYLQRNTVNHYSA